MRAKLTYVHPKICDLRSDVRIHLSDIMASSEFFPRFPNQPHGQCQKYTKLLSPTQFTCALAFREKKEDKSPGSFKINSYALQSLLFLERLADLYALLVLSAAAGFVPSANVIRPRSHGSPYVC